MKRWAVSVVLIKENFMRGEHEFVNSLYEILAVNEDAATGLAFKQSQGDNPEYRICVITAMLVSDNEL